MNRIKEIDSFNYFFIESMIKSHFFILFILSIPV